MMFIVVMSWKITNLTSRNICCLKHCGTHILYKHTHIIYMNNIARNILLAVATIIPSGNALAQIPDGYYDALKGKKGAELKTAVHKIIKDANVLNYGSGPSSTWWGFYSTDNDNGYVIDRYSNNRVKFVSRGAVASGMNIEHSFPKSWWGGSKNQAYKDLYNLMPSDSKANSSKSNYGMGIVTEVSYENGLLVTIMHRWSRAMSA